MTIFTKYENRKSSPGEVMLDSHMFTPGDVICTYLDGMKEACIYVATAGREFDGELKRIYAENDIFSSFIADAVGTVLVELAISVSGFFALLQKTRQENVSQVQFDASSGLGNLLPSSEA